MYIKLCVCCVCVCVCVCVYITGGAVDPGETFSEAAVRETKEEAGIDVELKGILKVMWC